jgi:metal-responsive CopG/Arc/MetJ family transcriptional regulator
MAEQEVRELTDCAKKLRVSRADLIRRACREYLDQMRAARLDKIYERGYVEHPEDEAAATASMKAWASAHSDEEWPT